MIKEFIERNGIPWNRWELMTSMEARSLRGSYVPHTPGGIVLYELPEAKDETPSGDILSVVQQLIEQNYISIRDSIDEDIAVAYLAEASSYLKSLSLSKQGLLDYTLNDSNIYKTGICGETANKLNVISMGSKLSDTNLDGLIQTFRRTDLPRIYAVVHIAPSHRFHVEKVVDNVFLLQSWVGRFSLASWVSKGNIEWGLNEFLTAVQFALPAEPDTDLNQYYSLLFNLKGADLTPSAHTADQVTCTIYQSADNKTVCKSIEDTYLADVSKWS